MIFLVKVVWPTSYQLSFSKININERHPPMTTGIRMLHSPLNPWARSSERRRLQGIADPSLGRHTFLPITFQLPPSLPLKPSGITLPSSFAASYKLPFNHLFSRRALASSLPGLNFQSYLKYGVLQLSKIKGKQLCIYSDLNLLLRKRNPRHRIVLTEGSPYQKGLWYVPGLLTKRPQWSVMSNSY